MNSFLNLIFESFSFLLAKLLQIKTNKSSLQLKKTSQERSNDIKKLPQKRFSCVGDLQLFRNSGFQFLRRLLDWSQFPVELCAKPETSFIKYLKGAQVWDFRPIFFYINKSYMARWLEDWRKNKKFSKTTADIRHFGFFTQTEPALKICLRRLSLR